MSIRRVGVEEEMLLLDPLTRHLRPVSEDVVGQGNGAEHELFLEQVETQSRPHVDLQDVRRDLAQAREVAAASARAVGARLAAAPVPILADHDGQITPKERYRLMLAEFGEIGRRTLVCGTHVHVEIADDDEGVAVIDRLRAWLPLVLALSVNSPFFRGTDTGHASWRAQLWDTWPTAGPIEPFGGAVGYHSAVADLVASGAAIDTGMIYFDARLSRSFPTVEIRVADVCTELDDTIVVAAIVRALVETQAAMWRQLSPVPTWRVDLLRAARWRARRNGLDEQLIDPVSGHLVPAATALATLLRSIEPALRVSGDLDLVREGIDRLLHEGTGAARQRAVAGPHLDLSAVVDDVIVRTVRYEVYSGDDRVRHVGPRRPDKGRHMTALAAYLQTHLAGSRAGIDLFARSANGQLDHEIGMELTDIRREVVNERDQLQQIMRSLDVDENLVRSTAARIAERVARLKPNGSLLHRTPLTDLVETEALRIAVSGKQAGWEALLTISDLVPELDREQLEQLVSQGKDQLERLGELHAIVARRALTPE